MKNYILKDIYNSIRSLLSGKSVADDYILKGIYNSVAISLEFIDTCESLHFERDVQRQWLKFNFQLGYSR